MKSPATNLIVPTGIVLGVAGLFASSVLLYRGSVTMAGEIGARTVTFAVLNDVRQLTATLEAAETLQRRFLLTGEAEAGARYRAPASEAMDLLARLLDPDRMETLPVRRLLQRTDSLVRHRIARADSCSIRRPSGYSANPEA
ncbi:MAG: hypothetical protein ACRELX_09465 [Longimicrobiales bacterium]